MAQRFEVSVAEYVAKAKEQAEVAFRGTAQAAVGRVQELSPVKTGFFRSNWSAIKDGEQVPTASAAGGDTSAIQSAKLGEKIVVVNPVVYGLVLEHGFVGEDKNGRPIHRMGNHMVQQTVTELPAIAQRVVRDLQSKD